MKNSIRLNHLQELVQKASDFLIASENQDIDVIIKSILRQCSESMGMDRGFLMRFSPEGDNIEKIYQWNSSVTESITTLMDIWLAAFTPWTAEIYLTRKTAVYPENNHTVPSITAEYFQTHRIKSFFCQPVLMDLLLVGCLGFESRQTQPPMTSDEKALLKVLSNILISCLRRYELNNELLNARQMAESAAILKQRFIKNIRHEFRTYLGNIASATHLVLARVSDPGARKLLFMVQPEVHAILHSLNNILEYSLIQSKGVVLESRCFMLRDKVFNIVESFLDKAGSKSIELLLDMDDSVPHYVSGDALRLELILKNLLDNAIMFTEAGRVVFTVRASSCPPGLPVQDRLYTCVNSSVIEQGQPTDKPKKRSAFFDEKSEPHAAVHFSIQDTGPGMEQQVLSDIFEPFYQKDSSMNRPRKGMGLGLTIAGEIIKMMGTDIKVQSSPGHGSTFSFTLNMAIDCGEKLAREAYQNIQTGTNVQTGLQMANAETILVADDRTFNREIIRDILGYGGYRVVLAGDGAEAFDFFCQRHFDLVILDWHMPLMNGIKTAEKIRRREFGLGLVPVPIIVISSDLQADCMAACKKSNILDILPKPLDPTKLLAAVSRNLHQRPFDEDALNVSMQISDKSLSDLGTDPKRIKEFYQILCSDIQEDMQNIRNAFAAGDYNALGNAAHSLKGLCFQLSDHSAAKMAAALQDAPEKATAARIDELSECIASACTLPKKPE